MHEQPLVSQEIQDMIDLKLDQQKPPITGNQLLIEEMRKQKESGAQNA